MEGEGLERIPAIAAKGRYMREPKKSPITEISILYKRGSKNNVKNIGKGGGCRAK
jgi:hypothetical protein